METRLTERTIAHRWRRLDNDQVDRVPGGQLVGDVSSAFPVGLSVLGDDLDRVALSTDRSAVLEDLSHGLQDEGVRLAEERKRARLGAYISNRECFGLDNGRSRQAGQHRLRPDCGTSLQDSPSRNNMTGNRYRHSPPG